MSPECERWREVAAELALGIADGEDRARALEHLAECLECRAELERLSAAADKLLLLAPASEPPAGFEDRVAKAIHPPPRQAEGPRRLALPVAAALGAAALAAGAVWLALGDDRDLADSYRETLAVADGEHFDAASLELPGGEKVGYIYGYQGRTSWVFAVLYDIPAGDYRLELITNRGEQHVVRGLEVSGGEGSGGGVTPAPYDELTEVRLLDDRGREVADSELRK